MKKLYLLIALLAVSMLVLAGCGCDHEWKDATCTEPKTCTLCDETDGKAPGHDWEDATCTEPKICTVCEETEGEAKGHTPSTSTEVIDHVTALVAQTSVCPACEEEIVVAESKLDTFISTDKRFLFSAEELMERMVYLTEDAYDDVDYEIEYTEGSLLGYFYADDEMVLIQFFNEDMESITKADAKKGDILQAVSVVIYGDEDTDLPYYFYIATDPKLDMDAAKTRNERVGTILASAMTSGQQMGYYEAADLLYEAGYFPAGTLVEGLSVSMINIYSEDFR